MKFARDFLVPISTLHQNCPNNLRLCHVLTDIHFYLRAYLIHTKFLYLYISFMSLCLLYYTAHLSLLTCLIRYHTILRILIVLHVTYLPSDLKRIHLKHSQTECILMFSRADFLVQFSNSCFSP